MARAARPRRRDIAPIGYEEGGSAPTPPVLSAASAVDFSDIFVWGRATTDTASGTLYAVVVPQADATPTAEQIAESKNAAGTVITQSANVAVSSAGAQTLLIRNLTAVTAYKVCFTHMVAAVRLISSYSNVVTANFTTDTLVASFATNGLATNLQASTGCGTVGTNIADPHGGTNAVRYVDNNSATSNQCLLNCNGITFFNGVNKFHVTVKHQGGAAHLRQIASGITVASATAWFNTSTGAIGTINAAVWTPAPVVFDVGSGWKMFSGTANLAGADVVGVLGLNKGNVDNNLTISSLNGTHIQDLYNIRITRV